MGRILSQGLAKAALASALILVGAASVRADDVTDFYKGKTVTIVVGFGAGGGFDLYARLVATHWGRFIPGNPNVIAQNMPGAGSLKAARYLYKAGARDGTMVGIMLPHLVVSVLMRKDGTVKPAEFNWVGRVSEHISFAVARKDAGSSSIADALSKQIVVGATAKGNITATVAYALNNLIGTKFKVVAGYRGSSALALALDKREVDAVGAISWELLNTRKRDWVTEKKINFLWVLYPKRFPGAPEVPSFVEFAKSPSDRAVLGFLGSGPLPGRSFAAPPGVPTARMAALRESFMAMVNDKAFLADAKKRKLGVNAAPGSVVQAIIERIVATPQDIIDKTVEAIKPQ
jgi:tripartite-type tricarboxylate transporter receptor subunit TctC